MAHKSYAQLPCFQLAVQNFLQLKCELFESDKLLQQGKPHWSRLILQVIGNSAAGTARALFDQLHYSRRWIFCGSFIFQLGSGFLAWILILHFLSVGVDFELLCKDAYMQATVLSTQMIRVSSSDGDCVGFHYSAQTTMLTVSGMDVLISLQAIQHTLFFLS